MLLFAAADATSDLKVCTQNSLGSITAEIPFIKIPSNGVAGRFTNTERYHIKFSRKFSHCLLKS